MLLSNKSGDGFLSAVSYTTGLADTAGVDFRRFVVDFGFGVEFVGTGVLPAVAALLETVVATGALLALGTAGNDFLPCGGRLPIGSSRLVAA